jgi:hypothetical protein
MTPRHPMLGGPGMPQPQGMLATGLTQELQRCVGAWPPSVQVEALRALLDGRRLILICTTATPDAATSIRMEVRASAPGSPPEPR